MSEPHGSLWLPTQQPEAVAVIEIPAELKPAILVFLEKAVDIRYLTMFPDVHGFAEGYSVDAGEPDRW